MVRNFTMALLMILLGNIAAAQNLKSTKLTASDGSGSDEFGVSVAISGDYAMAGAHRDRPKGSYSGSAYVFKRNTNGWTQEQKLIANDATSYLRFGWAVAISGDYAIIGAKGDFHAGKNSGSAYIFKRDGANWVQLVKLTKSNAVRDEEFGYAVTIEGDYAAVGAWGVSSGAGVVYVYKRTGAVWNEHAKLAPSELAAGNLFGGAVALSGNHLLVGAPGANAAYVFFFNGATWTQQAKLLANDGASGDAFGGAVFLSGEYAVIGAKQDDDKGSNSGSAYVFKRTGTSWLQQSKLVMIDGAAEDMFGASVAIAGDEAIIGANQDDDQGSNSGSAYLFKRVQTNWVLQNKLTANDGAVDDQFGVAVALSGGQAIVGAWYDDDHDTDSGAAHVFSNLNVSDVAAEKVEVPAQFVLEQNYPNPFFGEAAAPSGGNLSTTIRYQLLQTAHVELAIYNAIGKKIKTLMRSAQTRGTHQARWDGKDELGVRVASGVYWYRLRAGSFSQARKMIYLR